MQSVHSPYVTPPTAEQVGSGRNFLTHRTALLSAAVTALLGVSGTTAFAQTLGNNQPLHPDGEAPQFIDGTEFEEYPGDPNGIARETRRVEQCKKLGQTSIDELISIRPSRKDRSKAIVRMHRADISGICDGYTLRTTESFRLKAKPVGAKTWRLGEKLWQDTSTNGGRNYTLKLDIGQPCEAGTKLSVKPVIATRNQSNTLGYFGFKYRAIVRKPPQELPAVEVACPL